jgi:DNA (cytosine-5)-methyltransferase 1
VIVLENVTGLFSAREGRDFVAVIEAMTALGYAVGALEIDAALFVPQSRPRAFLVAARQASRALCSAGPALPFHSAGVVSAFGRLTPAQRQHWRWWQLPTPPWRNTTLADSLDPPDLVPWHAAHETEQLLGLMAPAQRARLEALRGDLEPHVGAGYRRIRTADARKQQRFEVRFDGVAGCLRTPAGGSSRQFVVDVRDGVVRTRLMRPRETARLMGLPDDFPLPESAMKALRITGDGVVVPVTRWLSRMLLMPLAGLSPHPGLQGAMAE